MSSDFGGSSLLSLNPGTILDGRYEITGFLGEGGFATVYKARQLNIQRDVAIKVLNPGTDARTAKAFEERFLREARTAAQINHPNVVSIYDFGLTDQLRQPYIAMEMLSGHDLEEELQSNGPMESDRLMPLFCEALEALGEAHKLGIVHKDLKPSNLFLVNPGSRREMIKIVDFGIARVREVEGKKLTGTGQILGTPQYLAPEYIQSQIATPALDVYQMGLILIELLTGRAVVDHDNPYQCLMVHGSGALEVPASLVSGALGGVLLKSLEHDHNARFHDAEAFFLALKDVDFGTIPHVEPSEIRRKITEVSGSLRQVAISGTAQTGEFNQPGGPRQRVPTVAGSVGGMGAMAPTGAMSTGHSPTAAMSAPNSAVSAEFGPTSQSYPSGQISQPIDVAGGSSNKSTMMVAIGVVIIFLLVAVGGAVAFFAFGNKGTGDGTDKSPAVVVDKDKQEKANKPEEKPEEKPEDKPEEKPVAAVDDKPDEEGKPGEEDKPKEEPVVEKVEVAIDPIPATAEVFVAGTSLGTGRVTYTFEEGKDAKPVELSIKARGFDTHKAELSPGQGPELAITLKRTRNVRNNNKKPPVKKPVAENKPPVEKNPPVEKKPPVKKDKGGGMGFVE